MLLDSGLVLYVGLLVLGVWRWLSGWRLCGWRLQLLNYCTLLYVLLLVLLIYGLQIFIRTAMSDDGKTAWKALPGWLRPLMLGAPAMATISTFLSAWQTLQHMGEIRADRAPLKHDRAVQIIALPAVYGIMGLNSMARMFQLNSGYFKDDIQIRAKSRRSMSVEDTEQLYISKSETCFWVGDLYEAWALFQFGKLTLELIRAGLWKMHRSARLGEREKARALMVAHTAVENVAWLGVFLFLLVCVLQAGWSLYLLTFSGSHTDWATYNSRAGQFGAAGMVASAGAMYNIHVVESTFHHYFEGYRPLLKFITVKIIVSFAFFQKGVFKVLEAMSETFPVFMQRIIRGCPLIGDILGFNEVQFQLFYDSLILYECIVISLLHFYAWSAYEEWYLEDTEIEVARDLAGPLEGGDVKDELDKGDEDLGERQPLLTQPPQYMSASASVSTTNVATPEQHV